jgi:hypothetical protein
VNFSGHASELPDGVCKLSILLSAFVIVFKLSIKMIQIIHRWKVMKKVQIFI